MIHVDRASVLESDRKEAEDVGTRDNVIVVVEKLDRTVCESPTTKG